MRNAPFLSFRIHDATYAKAFDTSDSSNFLFFLYLCSSPTQWAKIITKDNIKQLNNESKTSFHLFDMFGTCIPVGATPLSESCTLSA